MFPGTTTKLSETIQASDATINANHDLIKLTGSTSIATIIPRAGGGFGQVVVLVPIDGTLGLLTTGNIAIAVTMPLKRATFLVYSRVSNLWYPGAIS